MQYAAEKGYRIILDQVRKDNPASIRVHEKLGFESDGYIYQNQKNKTWGDYKKGSVWGNNLVFCALAGALWYSQFFGLSLGQSFFEKGGTMFVLSFCILMALNVVFSNVWGIILKEWKGCSGKTIGVLIAGIVVLIISTFLPTIIDSLSK